MEVNCPSCGSQHRSEDYPGAFDILCGCGYLILNPDLGEDGKEYNEINFEGPPAAGETEAKDLIKVHQEDALAVSLQSPDNLEFSAESLTPPEELPEGMLYDPAEVPQHEEPVLDQLPKTSESTLSRIFVEKVQKASIGQILGPDYDLEFSDLDPNARLKARDRIDRFLQDHKWLREEMERRSFVIAELFLNEKAVGIPEALAVEMYIACLENGGKCLFVRHNLALSA